MIIIQEIPIENIDDFWKIHMRYLVDDQIVTAPEDIAYFESNEYRDIIREHMLREQDRKVSITKQALKAKISACIACFIRDNR